MPLLLPCWSRLTHASFLLLLYRIIRTTTTTTTKQQIPYGQIKSITGNNPKLGLLSRPHVITTGTMTTTTNGSSTDIGVFVFAAMKEQDEFVALVEDRKQQHQHQRGGWSVRQTALYLDFLKCARVDGLAKAPFSPKRAH
jgi:hypothetical protein